MIYLPHPTFDFQGANGGLVSGFVPPSVKEVDDFHAASGTDGRAMGWDVGCGGRNLGDKWEIDVHKIISKFDKATSNYWTERTRSISSRADPFYTGASDLSYCFLREDGHEFAIRFTRLSKMVYGGPGSFTLQQEPWWNVSTWHRCKPVSSPVIERPTDEFKLWLERVAPKSA